nr:MAG TPA: hypothetical protein [Caudoviricetes sp.]
MCSKTLDYYPTRKKVLSMPKKKYFLSQADLSKLHVFKNS